jgi:hypothetical protein
MKLYYNARDREAGEWPTLFEEADSRYKFIGVRDYPRESGSNVGSRLATIEAVWER